MIEWKYIRHYINDIEFIEKAIPGAIGFVYEITLSNGMRYIGKKNLYSTRKRNYGKKELAKITDKRLKTYEMVKKESDWKKYYGSSDRVKDAVKKGEVEVVNREILEFAFSNSQLTYLETKYLFVREVLEKGDIYYNDHILKKFFKNNI